MSGFLVNMIDSKRNKTKEEEEEVYFNAFNKKNNLEFIIFSF